MKKSYNGVEVPAQGATIEYSGDGMFRVPDRPIIPFIEGDGTGRDIWKASRAVFDAAVEKAYGGKRKVEWLEIFAGEKAHRQFHEWLPQDTVDAIRDFRVAIKGPLTTPVGGGIRSLNVTLRQVLDLYSCVRPVRYFEGVPSPVREPQRMNVVIFRENTEDVYAGIEWRSGSAEVKKLIAYLNDEMLKGTTKKIREDSGIGIKPMSPTGTKRLVRRAIVYALDNQRTIVTLVHKGNIQKFTEGAFRDWGYELATQEFRPVRRHRTRELDTRQQGRQSGHHHRSQRRSHRTWSRPSHRRIPQTAPRRSEARARHPVRIARQRSVEEKDID